MPTVYIHCATGYKQQPDYAPSPLYHMMQAGLPVEVETSSRHISSRPASIPLLDRLKRVFLAKGPEMPMLLQVQLSGALLIYT